jgi:hypothetical protein
MTLRRHRKARMMLILHSPNHNMMLFADALHDDSRNSSRALQTDHERNSSRTHSRAFSRAILVIVLRRLIVRRHGVMKSVLEVESEQMRAWLLVNEREHVRSEATSGARINLRVATPRELQERGRTCDRGARFKNGWPWVARRASPGIRTINRGAQKRSVRPKPGKCLPHTDLGSFSGTKRPPCPLEGQGGFLIECRVRNAVFQPRPRQHHVYPSIRKGPYE